MKMQTMRLPAYPQHPQPHSFGHRWILGGTDLLCPALLDNRCPTRRWKQRQQWWWQQHQHQHQQRQQQQQRLLARRFRSRQLQLLALRHARALARTERVFCPCCRDSRCRRPELQRHPIPLCSCRRRSERPAGTRRLPAALYRQSPLL